MSLMIKEKSQRLFIPFEAEYQAVNACIAYQAARLHCSGRGDSGSGHPECGMARTHGGDPGRSLSGWRSQ